jgi:hypothetical protein
MEEIMFWLWMAGSFVAGAIIGGFIIYRWLINGFQNAVGRAFGWW